MCFPAAEEQTKGLKHGGSQKRSSLQRTWSLLGRMLGSVSTQTKLEAKRSQVQRGSPVLGVLIPNSFLSYLELLFHPQYFSLSLVITPTTGCNKLERSSLVIHPPKTKLQN